MQKSKQTSSTYKLKGFLHYEVNLNDLSDVTRHQHFKLGVGYTIRVNKLYPDELKNVDVFGYLEIF